MSITTTETTTKQKVKKKRDTQRILEIDWQQGRSEPQIEIGIAYPKYTVTYTIYNPIYSI